MYCCCHQWLGGSELPGSGGYSAESYGGDASQDVQPSGAHTHQRVSVPLYLTEKEPLVVVFQYIYGEEKFLVIWHNDDNLKLRVGGKVDYFR